MTLVLAGSMAIEFTARLAMESVSGTHDAPPLDLFQTPPTTPPAYIGVGVRGSIRMDRVLPPMLPGPSGDHEPSATAVCALDGRPLSWGDGSHRPPAAVECRGMLRMA